MLDWFTVAAQIVNFLLLIYLLKRFLYKPILNAIAAREERIARTVADADAAKAAALEQIEEYRHKNAAWEAELESMRVEARAEVEAMRKEWMSKAHVEVEQAQQHWQKALQQQKQTFLHRLRLQVSEQTYRLAQRVLADLADSDLEGRIIRVFLKRIDLMDNHELDNLRASLAQTGGELMVRTAFDLSPEDQLPIQQTVENKLGTAPGINYEMSPEIGYGIELRANGYKLSWNLDDYLQTLEEALNDQLSGAIED